MNFNQNKFLFLHGIAWKSLQTISDNTPAVEKLGLNFSIVWKILIQSQELQKLILKKSKVNWKCFVRNSLHVRRVRSTNFI